MSVDPSGAVNFEHVRVRLTVAAVAKRLGVAASTLRTWDRRYGLGPSSRTAGKHRRYNADDVTRLESMRRFTRQGVAPADAARLALGLAADGVVEEPIEEAETNNLDPLSIAAAAVEAKDHRLRRMLNHAVQQANVLSVWQNLVRPAIELLEVRDHGDQPGRDSIAVLGSALLAVIRDRTSEATETRVIIHADDQHCIDAHVLASELSTAQIGARVLRGGRRERSAQGLAKNVTDTVELAVLIGDPRDGLAVVEAMEAWGRATFVISLTGVPSPFTELPRARTLAGAVHEIESVLAERSALDLASKSG